jgi:AAA+ ATPase superfamily predicted ATPase
MNPFLISGYKSPEYFCDREKETQKLINAIENSRNVTLISERRIGKTVLLNHVANRVQNQVVFIYIDLYPTLQLKDFNKLLSEKVIEKLEPFSDKVIRKLTVLFSALRPSFSFDPETGAPNLELNIHSVSDAEKSISLLFQYIRESGKKVVIAFDEFQQILSYPEKNVEALLRSEIQKDTNSCFIFSGSRKHLLISMFNEYSRPFYQSAEILPLEKIEKEEYTKFITHHFQTNNFEINESTPAYIYELNNGITYNVQYICNKMFSQQGEVFDNKLADKILDEVLKENELVYYNYRELVTTLQFKILKAIAIEKVVEKPYSNEFIGKYKLKSTSSVKTSIEILLKKGILAQQQQGIRVSDLYFSFWLAKQL